MIAEALVETKKEKSPGPSGLNVKLILAGFKDIIMTITHLLNCVVADAGMEILLK